MATAIIEEMERPPLDRRVTIPTWDDCAERLLGIYRGILDAGLGELGQAGRVCDQHPLAERGRLLEAGRPQQSA